MTPGFEVDPSAFRHLADAQVNVELDTGDMVINLGPQHPATHGTLRLVVRLDGERVVDAMPEMGYLHSGFDLARDAGQFELRTQFLSVGDVAGNDVHAQPLGGERRPTDPETIE